MINPLEWEFGPKVDLNNIGLQLYTVREEMNNDPLGTLKQVKSIGYTHIESAGYNKRQFYGQTKENFKMILRDQGLQIHSGHINTGFGLGKDTYNMTNNWEAVCEDAAFLGQKYIVCGWFAPDERKTLDDYKRFAQLFNKCGETAKKYNLQFCHHNHDFEFFAIDGVVPYDILLNETDKTLVKFELDHYWTRKAAVDIKKIIKKHPGRFPLFHIKDMDATPEKSFTEVGTGVINWKSVFNLAPNAGMDFYFVEQDASTKMKPLDSIKVSFDNLRKMKL
ncbi:MAG: sugar phosphate isomerase/epimerase [Saprospiraceae bacterium]|nr:sugar phosphate isomerase/epimerase [Saprospiraceae bacterium]